MRSENFKKLNLFSFQGEYQSIELHAASDTGLKYAYVSGDWNPHHLYTWTARILGYRAPIAHGLWTLARSVACISGKAISFAYISGRAFLLTCVSGRAISLLIFQAELSICLYFR